MQFEDRVRNDTDILPMCADTVFANCMPRMRATVDMCRQIVAPMNTYLGCGVHVTVFCERRTRVVGKV